MRIAFVCPYSYPSICGVWNRVFEIAKRLAKKHEIHVFSSNEIKGTNKISSEYELYKGIHIYRFPIKFKISENAKYFSFEKKLIEIKPELIVTEVYRHPHSTKALKLAKKLNIPCILTTHAPFLEKGIRPFYLEMLVKMYDLVIGRRIFKKYNKIIAITKWEIPYLKKLGAKNIVYIPNGIPDEFFKVKSKNGSYILYLGRIAPIKNLEMLNNLSYDVKLVGPKEGGYYKKLKFKIEDPVYDLKKKIDIYNNCKVFILPSKREGMPQSLIEAMALKKIVIGSDIIGIKEIVIDGKNGFIFKDVNELKEKVDLAMKKDLNEIRKNAFETAKKYKWSVLIKEIENAYGLG